MPFKSDSQKRYLFSQRPKVAEEFAEHTPKNTLKKLPERVGDPKTINDHMKQVSHKFMRSKSIK